MHYHLEIVLPPDHENLEEAVAAVLAPFDENVEENRQPFWDWWVIGGRYAGQKLLAGLDQSKVTEFYQWMKDEGVTVSGFVAGKQELSPKDQIPKVDAKWREMFPQSKQETCPLFNHSNDQYGRVGESTIRGDISKLGESPADLECERVIFAGREWEDDGWTGRIRPVFMLSRDWWNGVNHLNSDWDGKVSTAIERWRKHMESYAHRYRLIHEPNDEWIVVTVDYHS